MANMVKSRITLGKRNPKNVSCFQSPIIQNRPTIFYVISEKAHILKHINAIIPDVFPDLRIRSQLPTSGPNEELVQCVFDYTYSFRKMLYWNAVADTKRLEYESLLNLIHESEFLGLIA